MIKKKEVRVCDFCGNEISGRFISTTDVPNEGCSEIRYGNAHGGQTFEVGEQDYCNIDCLTNDIKKHLKIEDGE